MKINIGIIQSAVTMDKARNMESILELIHELAQQGAQIIALPEMFYCPYSNDYFRALAEPAQGSCWQMLAKAAVDNKVYLVGGSFPELDQNKVYNTCFVFDDSGKQIARHRKVHLFDIDIKGGQYFKESAVFSAGNDYTVFDTPWGKMGVVICFDYRFPELARLTTLAGAQVIFVPAAFNMTTGPVHWEITHKVRSLDNQIYTVAAAPARDEKGVYVSYANSMVVSPWGDVLWRAGSKPETKVIEIDLDYVQNIRNQLPLIQQMRTDLYAVTWKKPIQ